MFCPSRQASNSLLTMLTVTVPFQEMAWGYDSRERIPPTGAIDRRTSHWHFRWLRALYEEATKRKGKACLIPNHIMKVAWPDGWRWEAHQLASLMSSTVLSQIYPAWYTAPTTSSRKTAHTSTRHGTPFNIEPSDAAMLVITMISDFGRSAELTVANGDNDHRPLGEACCMLHFYGDRINWKPVG